MAQSKKDFRHALSVLKKQGIIPAHLDARKAQPYFVRKLGPRGGEYRLDEFVRKHQSSVDKYDFAHAPKVTPAKAAKAAKAKPLKTPEPFIPPVSSEPAPANGIQVIDLGVKANDIESYLKKASRDHKRIDRMKTDRESFAFTFFGHQSMHVFDDIESMLEYLSKYQTIEAAMGNRSVKDMREILESLVVVKVPTMATWSDAYQKKRKVQTEKHKIKEYKRRKQREKKQPEWKQDERRARKAKEQKALRARLTGAAKEAYKAAAKARQAKSYANLHPKKDKPK